MAQSIAPLLALALASSVAAHVTSIVVPSTFQVTSNSVLPVNLTTTDGPNTYQDFAVAIGIGSPTVVPPQLGNEILRVFNLRRRAPVTPRGNYTLQVPLNSSNVGIYQSPGQYTIAAAVMAGVGALYGAQLNVFNQTIELQW